MMLGEVVGPVFISWCPIDFELALFYSVLQPVETHVDGFAALLFNSAIDNAIGSGVVSFYGRWWLRVTQFF